MSDPSAFVRAETILAAPPLVPEIRLHLASEVVPLWQATEESLTRQGIPLGGLPRFREFWRFYELRWGIGVTGIKLVYIPFAVLGLVAALKIWA